MQSLIQTIMALIPTSVDVAALAVLLIFVPLFVVFTARAKSGRRFPLRPIPAYTRMQHLVSHATESGQPIHVGMGSGQIGSEATPEALMATTVFDYIARHAAVASQTVLGTTGDATILSTAQGILREAHQEAGFLDAYAGTELNFSGPDPLAYAIGAQQSLGHKQHLASVLLGHFGAEGLWLAESTARQDMLQLGGTSDPAAATLLKASLDETVIGEEVYAAGAYLHRPSHLGSLATQDIVRLVLMLSVIVGVVMTSLGYWR
jgi:hypothetical protein